MSGIGKLGSATSEITDFRRLFCGENEITEQAGNTAQNSEELQSKALEQSFGGGVMAGNFAGLRGGQSKYVKTTLASFGQATLRDTLQQQNTLALIAEGMSLADPRAMANPGQANAELYRLSLKVERMMYRKQREAQQEAGEQALEEIKDEREARIKEMLAPEGADGEALEIGPDAVSAAQVEAPEISAPEPQAAQPSEAEISSAQAAAPLELTGQDELAAAPQAASSPPPKIDIVI